MNTVEISVLAFPDGTTLFVKNDPIKVRKKIESWKESLSAERIKEFDDAKLHGGVINIKMLKRDWDRMKNDSR